MEQTEFYERLLDLENPWDVSDVNLDVGGGQVEVFLEHDDDHSWCCRLW